MTLLLLWLSAGRLGCPGPDLALRYPEYELDYA